MTFAIEQTLHGYDDGHRLLASSTQLDLDEERALDLLSDLSGYLPSGTDFASYDTGYPCGRFYVFARTWPDRAGRRSGTVFTHSLLIPRDEVAGLANIAALRPFFWMPNHPVGRDAYRRPIQWQPEASPEPWLPPTARRLLAALWFGQDARPLLWTDVVSAATVADLLWMWLPPWLRAAHTFCTFALQPRYLGPRLFDYLGIAPGAEGLFYSIRDRAVHCDGLASPPGAGPLVELPWVAEIAEGPADAVQVQWQDASTRGLSPLRANELRVFLRYQELRGRASANFTAALSCVDLLRRLAPDVGRAAEEKSAALWLCLEQARAAHLASRNLLHALDILERAPRTFAPALAPDIGAYLAETLAVRAAEQPDLAERVFHAAAPTGFTQPVRDGILESMRRTAETADVNSWRAAFSSIAAAILDDDPATVQRVLRMTPAGARESIIGTWLQAKPGDAQEAVVGAAFETAIDLHDAGLVELLAVHVSGAARLDAIRGITDPAVLTRLVAGVAPSAIAAWLVGRPPDTTLPPDVALAFVDALTNREAAAALFETTLPNGTGIPVLVAYAARVGPREAGSFLHAHPAAIAPLVRLAVAEPFRSGIDALLPDAIAQVDPATLLASVNPANAARWERAPWAQTLVERAVPAVLDEYLRGEATMATLRAWLVSPPCDMWLRSCSWLPASLQGPLENARGNAAVRAIELLVDSSAAQLRDNSYVVRDCLKAWAGQSAALIAPLVPNWVTLVKRIRDPELRAVVSGLSVQVALDKGDATLAPLAEVGFATAHRQLHEGESFGWLVAPFLMVLFGADWDRAGKLRETLARTWLENDWPPLSLLRAASGDADLFADLARRAKDRSGGKKALRQLWETARTSSEGDSTWDSMLARLPRSVREG